MLPSVDADVDTVVAAAPVVADVLAYGFNIFDVDVVAAYEYDGYCVAAAGAAACVRENRDLAPEEQEVAANIDTRWLRMRDMERERGVVLRWKWRWRSSSSSSSSTIICKDDRRSSIVGRRGERFGGNIAAVRVQKFGGKGTKVS